MAEKTYIRRSKHDKQNPYFMLRSDTAQNKTLSYDALGLLAYLLSKPDDWRVQIGDLKRESCGRDKARTILEELCTKGYARREEQGRDPKTGRFIYGDYEVSELPIYLAPHTENPYTENPSTAAPYTVNPTLHSIESDKVQNHQVQNTENLSSPDGDAASSQPNGTQSSSSSADAYRQVFGAVVEAWGHNGARAGNIAAMICGISKVKGWKEFNFDPPGNVAGVAVFKHWYTAQNKSATFPQSPEAIQAWYYKMRHDFQKNPHKAVFAPMRAMLPAAVSDEPEFTGSLTGVRHE